MAPLSEVGQSLLISLGIDGALNTLGYLISAPLQTERLYDLCGSITYLTTVLVALLVRPDPLHSLSGRQICTACLVIIWCLRLGIFLAVRVHSVPDKRFDEIKVDCVKFIVPWVAQTVWVFLTALPVYIVLGNPTHSQPPLGYWSDVVGIAVWIAGFSLEVVADQQKQSFKNRNPRDFMRSGVWAYSRWPNYFGEVSLWAGMWVLCARGFVEDWQFFSAISPLFVFALVYFGSGVAMSDANADKRYGSTPEYQQYKATTNKFVPWFPRNEPRVSL